MASASKAQYQKNLKRLKSALGGKYKTNPTTQSAVIIGGSHVKIDGKYYDAQVNAANAGGTVTVTNIGRLSAAIYSTGESGTVVVGSSQSAATGGGSGTDEALLLFRDGRNSLTGNLTVSDAITIDGVDISAHAANPDAHHARLHGITSASDHSVTGAAMDVVGLSTTNTLGILTPSSAPGAASAILKSDASGFLTLPKFVATTKVTTPLIDTASGDLTLSPASGTVQVSGRVYVQSDGYTFVQGTTVSDTAFPYLVINRARGTIGAESAVVSGDALMNISARGYHNGDAYHTVGSVDIRAYAAENFTATARGANLRLYTTATGTTTLAERLRIHDSGNISIGSTSDDGYKFDVNGTARITTSLTTPLLTTATNVDLVVDPAGTGAVQFPNDQKLRTSSFDSSFPILGWQINEHATITGKSVLTIGNIQADELSVRIFVADETRVDRGDEYWTKSYGIVYEQFVTPSSIGGTVTVTFEDSPALTGAIFSNNDWLLFRKLEIDTGLELFNIWGQVSTYVDNGNDTQSWTFTLRQGPIDKTIAKGSLGIDFGASGAALIHLSVIDDAGAPYIKMRTWTGADPYSPANYTTHVQLGNLGSIGNSYYTPAGDGLYIASNADEGQFIVADDNGLQLRGADFSEWNGSAQTVLIASADGSVKLGTDISSGTTTGLHFDGATGDLTIGNASYGSNVTVYGQIVIQNPEDINTGDLTNTAGWTVGATWGTNITNEPTELADINSAEGAKLLGIEDGATDGATWGTNLNSVPTRFGEAPSASGLYLTPTHLGFYNGSAWKAWIASNGFFYFGGNSGAHLEWNGTHLRGLGTDGTTVQWYADSTDGKIYAAAGSVWLDADGMNFAVKGVGEPDYVRFVSGASVLGSIGYIHTAGPTPGEFDGMIFDAGRHRFVDGGTEFASMTSTVTTINADLDVSGDIAVTGTVDGVDIAAFKTAYDSHNHSGVYLPLTGGTLTGTLTARAITFATDNTYDIGAADKRVQDLYVVNLHTDVIVGTPSYDHSHDAAYVNVGGDTMTATLVMAFDDFNMISLNRTANPNVDSTFTIGVSYSGGNDFAFFGKSDGLQVRDDSTVYIANNLVWHAGNDGASSGLDADTVDGVQAASLVQTSRTVTAGAGLTGGGALSSNITITHDDTSSQASVNNSGSTFIQDVTLDGFGHVTALVSADASTALSGVFVPMARTVTAGAGLTGGGALSSNITISHADTSSQASVNNSSYNVIQDVTLDTYGHVTALVSVDASTMLIGYLKADGTVIGATSQGQEFTNGISVNKSPTSIAVDVNGQIYCESASFPPFQATRTTALATGIVSGMRFVARTSDDMTDGFGTQILLGIEDSAGTINNIGGIRVVRAGADNAGTTQLLANAANVMMTILPSGYIGAGTLTPAAWLHIRSSSSAAASLRIDSGSGPSSPALGDIWNASNSLFFRATSITYSVGQDIYGDTLLLDDTITAAADTNTTHALGRAKIGYASVSDAATFAHYDHNTSTAAGLTQFSTGATQLQAATSQYIDLAINGTAKWTVNSERILPESTVVQDIGDYNRMVRSLWAAELQVQTLIAQDVLATIGGMIVVAPTTKLIADVSSSGTGGGYSGLVNGLVGYWSLDESSGTRDDEVNGFDLTNNNTVTSTTGKKSNAAVFTKANSEYLSRSDNTTLSFGTDTDLYIAFWVYPTLDDDSIMTLVSKGTNATQAFAVNINWATSLVYINVYNISGTLTSVFATDYGTLTTGGWYYIEAWHDALGNEVGISVNGTATTAVHSSGIRDDPGSFLVGAINSDSPTQFFQGRIDELGFWKGYLPDAAERSWLRNGTTGRTYAEITEYGAYIDVEHNNLARNDYVLLKTAPGGIAQIEAMKITTVPTTITGGYRYGATPNQDGTGRNNWYIGDAVVSRGGAAGEGFIELTSTSTVHSHQGPTMAIYNRTSTDAWNSVDPVVAIGNLRSFIDYASDTAGIAFGNDLELTPTTGFKGMAAEGTNGLRLFSIDLSSYNGSTMTANLSSTGNLKLGTNVANLATTSFDFTASNGNLRIGELGANLPNINWNGTELAFRINTAAYIVLNTSGSAYLAGVLSVGSAGGIYQGSSGSFGSPGTGLKIWNDSGVGRLATYNSGTAQVYLDTGGKLNAGGGAVWLASTGLNLDEDVSANSKIRFLNSGTLKGEIFSDSGILTARSTTGTTTSYVQIMGQGSGGIGDGALLRVGTISSVPQIVFNLGAVNRAIMTTSALDMTLIDIDMNGNDITDVGLLSMSGDIDMNGNDITDIGTLGGAWTNVTYNTGWGTKAGYQAMQYKKVGDFVFLRGVVERTSGSSSTICTLPSGHRPPSDELFATYAGGSLGAITVTSAGPVILGVGAVTLVATSPVRFSIN